MFDRLPILEVDAEKLCGRQLFVHTDATTAIEYVIMNGIIIILNVYDLTPAPTGGTE